MVADAQVKLVSLAFSLFRNMYLAGTWHFISPQLLVLTLSKGTIIFGGGPVSSLILHSFISTSAVSFDPFDVVSDNPFMLRLFHR